MKCQPVVKSGVGQLHERRRVKRRHVGKKCKDDIAMRGGNSTCDRWARSDSFFSSVACGGTLSLWIPRTLRRLTFRGEANELHRQVLQSVAWRRARLLAATELQHGVRDSARPTSRFRAPRLVAAVFMRIETCSMAVIKRLSSYGKNVVAAPRASENPGVSPDLVKVDGNVVSDTGLLGGRYDVTLNHFGCFSTFTGSRVCLLRNTTGPPRVAK